jgi:NitT/TauT family transport system permease protein
VLLGSIVGEFAGSKQGLGTLILYANENLETARTFSILAILAGIGLIFHFAIVALRRRVLFWAPPRRSHSPSASSKARP